MAKMNIKAKGKAVQKSQNWRLKTKQKSVSDGSSHYKQYRANAPNKNTLLKSMRENVYIVLEDQFSRLYFITYSPFHNHQWHRSTTYPCYLMLSRAHADPENITQDERIYTFPNEGEKVRLRLYWFFGKKIQKDHQREPHCVDGFIYDSYRYKNRVTGPATLWLPGGLPYS